MPVWPSGNTLTGSTVTATPTKLNRLKLFAKPTWTSLLKTVKEPGDKPPTCSDVDGTQYLSPGFPPTLSKTYWVPGGHGFAVIEDGPIKGSPKSGSAWVNPRNWYLSDVIATWGVLFTLLERYFAIIYCLAVSRMLRIKCIVLFELPEILIESPVSKTNLPSGIRESESFGGIGTLFANL